MTMTTTQDLARTADAAASPRDVTRWEIESRLPSASRAMWLDGTAWVVWLVVATLVRTLTATQHILYPRHLTVAVVAALAVQLATRRMLRSYWPWASPRSNRYILVAAAGYALGACSLVLVAGVRLIPWPAALAGSAGAALTQVTHRARWWRRARAQARKELL